MPNHKLGLISPTIGFAIIAALPTPESRTATTMIQKASKKVLLSRVQVAMLGYWVTLPGTGPPEGSLRRLALLVDATRISPWRQRVRH